MRAFLPPAIWMLAACSALAAKPNLVIILLNIREGILAIRRITWVFTMRHKEHLHRACRGR